MSILTQPCLPESRIARSGRLHTNAPVRTPRIFKPGGWRGGPVGRQWSPTRQGSLLLFQPCTYRQPPSPPLATRPFPLRWDGWLGWVGPSQPPRAMVGGWGSLPPPPPLSGPPTRSCSSKVPRPRWPAEGRGRGDGLRWGPRRGAKWRRGWAGERRRLP